MDVRTARPRLDALTGLRYVAALCVLLSHLSVNFPDGPIKKLASELWAIGMPLFFTLSGFLMAYNYSDGFRTSYRSTLRKFYLARFARIYPIYIVALLLWLSLSGHFFNDLRDHPRDTYLSLAMTATLTQNWVCVPVFAGTPSPRLASFAHMWIAWSVSVEFFFYLVFPLLVIPVLRYATSAHRAWFAAGAVYVLYVGIDFGLAKSGRASVPGIETLWLVLWNPYFRLGEFAIGVLVGQAFLHAARRPLSRQGWWFGATLLAGTIGALLYGNHWVWSDANRSGVSKVAAGNVLFAPLCAVLIYGLARIPCGFQRLMSTRPMVLLGEASYCMYLLHPLVQLLFAPRLQSAESTSIPALCFNLAMMLVFLHFLCFGLYCYAEVPMRSWVKHIFEGRRKTDSVAAPNESIPQRAAA
jgi:peptidoglycan/LPS O-acetylase OafA/YrhL